MLKLEVGELRVVQFNGRVVRPPGLPAVIHALSLFQWGIETHWSPTLAKTMHFLEGGRLGQLVLLVLPVGWTYWTSCALGTWALLGRHLGLTGPWFQLDLLGFTGQLGLVLLTPLGPVATWSPPTGLELARALGLLTLLVLLDWPTCSLAWPY